VDLKEGRGEEGREVVECRPASLSLRYRSLPCRVSLRCLIVGRGEEDLLQLTVLIVWEEEEGEEGEEEEGRHVRVVLLRLAFC